ncbi:MAG: 50S ribosomal protein L7/L12, partial [Chloroflexota bacterium]|nr:50S ribosomal protein L7/L12 [Chloroflexota bacterium]
VRNGLFDVPRFESCPDVEAYFEHSPDGAAAAPPAEEQTEFNAVLTDVGPNKILVIKAVRELTGLGLKEAKDLVDAAPKPIKEAVAREDADAVREKLAEAGATVEVR